MFGYKRKTKLSKKALRRANSRFLSSERLENRLMLASDWHNGCNAYDVSNDGYVTPLDALLPINRLNRVGAGDLPTPVPPNNPFYDTNNNGSLEPLDALLVINVLNGASGGGGQPRFSFEGELANDTGLETAQRSDGITSDAMLTGQMTSLLGLESLTARLNDGIPVDVSHSCGNFIFDPNLATDGSDDGSHRVEFVGLDAQQATSSFELSFTLDTQGPQLQFGLHQDSDSGLPGDGSTTHNRVNLKGYSEPGSRVEFNGSSLTVDASGEFVLAQVDLEAGANRFDIIAFDAAGNATSVSEQVTQAACDFEDDLFTGTDLAENMPWNGGHYDPLQPNNASLPLTSASGDRVQFASAILNQDFIADLVSLSNSTGEVLVQLGTSNNQFESATRYATGGSQPQAVTVANVIGDRLPDIVVGHVDGTLALLEGIGSGRFRLRPELTRSGLGDIVDLTVRDLDRDGDMDIVVSGSDRLTLLSNDDDALKANPITNGDFSEGIAGWKPSILGTSAGGTSGAISASSGFVQLVENESFLVSLSQTMVVPPTPQTISFDLAGIHLESSPGSLPDAFEISLLDGSFESVVPTISPHATSFFNVGSNGTATEMQTAVGVSLDGNRAELDISSLTPGEEVTLFIDLIGNQPGSGSVATIGNVQVTPDAVYTETFTATTLDGPFGIVAGVGTCDANGDGLFDIIVEESTSDSFIRFQNNDGGNFTRDNGGDGEGESTDRAISIGEVVNDTLASGAETDTFTFEANDGQKLFFDAQHTTGLQVWALTDPNGTQIFSSGLTDQDVLPITLTGTYSLSVSGFFGAQGPYRFQIHEVPTTSRTHIAIGETVDGSLNVPGEQTVFSFDGDAGQELFFDSLLPIGATHWTLSTPGGTEVFSGQLQDQDDVQLLESGLYTLLIDGESDQVGDFQFQINDVSPGVATPIELDSEVHGDIDIAGTTDRYSFFGTVGQHVYLDAHFGDAATLDFEILDASDQVIHTGNFTDSGPLELPSSGDYILQIDGVGDGKGPFGFILWSIPDAAPQPIRLEDAVPGALTVPGQTRAFQFSASEGQAILFDVIYSSTTHLSFSMNSPSGNSLFTGESNGASVASLPETGDYTLIVDATADNVGDFSIRVVNGSVLPPIGDSADLVVQDLRVPARSIGAQAAVEISWDIVNQGTTAVPAGTRITSAVHLSGDNHLDEFASDPRIGEFEVVLQSDLGPGSNLVQSEMISLPETRDVDFQILIAVDSHNVVFENQLEDNNTAAATTAVHQGRDLKGGPQLQFDFSNGQELPADQPITISGQTSVPAGAVNAIFMLDVSGSTKHISGLDANFDGLTNAEDDLNGDGNVGDLLDKEIGLVMETVSDLQQKVDDLRVAVVAWGMSSTAFPNAGEALDLGSPRFNQTFVNPGQSEQIDADFETALKSVSVTIQGLIGFAGATQFRPFIVGSGNNYDEALMEALDILNAAPDADENQIYFFTDGLFVTNEDLPAEESTIAELAEQGVQFRAAQVAGPDLVAQLCASSSPPDWCGAVETGDEFVDAVVDIVQGVDQGRSSASIVLADSPDDLGLVTFTETRIAGVTINGKAVASLDPSGGFFSVQSLKPGQNVVMATTIDSTGQTNDQQLTLTGVPDNTSDFDQFEDISSLGSVVFSGTTFNRSTKMLHVDAAVENQGSSLLSGPVRTTFHSIESPSVVLADAAGTSPNGDLYAEFSGELPTAGLPGGASSQFKHLQFENPMADRFQFDVALLALGNRAPQFSSTPTVLAERDSNYIYDLSAQDPDGDPVQFELVSGPEGMAVDQASGRLSWIPDAAQTGTHPVQVQAIDAFGGSTQQSFHISVQVDIPNRPPLFQSAPPTQLSSGNDFDYVPVTVDADGDAVTLTLDNAPLGMSLDPVTSSIQWTGPADGNYDIQITASDSAGNATTQAFVLSVGGTVANPAAPEILSNPATVASIGVAYFYLPLAQDPDGDTLVFSLVTSPDGAQIDQTTGTIHWTPSSAQVGDHPFLLRVEDGRGGFATQLFTVEVVENAPNLPPVFTTLPDRITSVDDSYRYDAHATDPDQGGLTFALLQSPTGMQVDAVSGVVTFVPTSSQLGNHRVELQVQDGQGGNATQTFDLVVGSSPNEAPRFTSTPLSGATVGKGYFYRATAVDADDAFTFELVTGPSGMILDETTGLIEFTPTIEQLGSHAVTIQTADERGAASQQSFELNVVNDTTAPVASIVLSINVVEPGTDVDIRVTAVDDVEVIDLQLTLDGNSVPLDGNGLTTFSQSTPGLYKFLATATDSVGNVGTTEAVLRVIDPSDQTPPEVQFVSPAPGDSIGYLTDIVGSVLADDLEFYRVDFAPTELIDVDDFAADNSAWTTLVESQDQTNESTLAIFDPTSLPNGPYLLRIYAQDFSGNADVKAVPITVDGPAKLGQFSLEFVDLSIPLAGLPIEVTRTYSTLNSDASGDFGFGWSLGAAQADIRETVALGIEEQVGIFGQTAFVHGTRVYITNPDGDRVGFTFEPERTASLLGQAYLPKFTPDPGVSDRLTVDPVTLSQQDDGTFVAFLVGFPFNPSEYTLHRPGGRVYNYDETLGLTNILDANGNQLTFSEDGITHSSGQSIQFQRDHLGRVTQILDPAGNEISYHYDASGNLVSVTDQTQLMTQFSYDANQAHYLSGVVDPLGRDVHRTEYDDAGRVTAVIDALGNRTEQTWDPANFTGSIVDGNLNVTELVYNDRGNVLVETDPLGNMTTYEYNDSRHPDLETKIIDRRGFVTEQEFDDRGNIIKIIEAGHKDSLFADPIITSFTYNDANQEISRTDARNNTTTRRYDDNGNLIEIIDADINSSSLTYDAEGRLATRTDFNQITTTYEYTIGDQPTKIAFADGTYLVLGYTPYGSITLEEAYEADGRLVERRTVSYDASGRVIETIDGVEGDAAHPAIITRAFYEGSQVDYQVIINHDSLDANGKLMETPETPIDQRLSRLADFEYDVADRLIQQSDGNGGVIEFRYDANGNRILLQDPVGNITTWLYDPLNRISEVRDPFYNENLTIDGALAALQRPSGADCQSNTGAAHVTLSCHDEEGNLTKSIDRNGRRREFNHDHAGRTEEERWFSVSNELLRTISFSYDVVGNVLTVTDPDSNYAFTYDALNRLVTEDNNPDGTLDVPHVVLTRSYDAEGNIIRTVDSLGVAVDSEYDQRNRLRSRKWSGSGIDPAGTDFLYNAADRVIEISRFSDLEATQLVARTTRTYDLAGRSDQITHRNAVAQILAEYDYDYNDFGEVAHESHHGQTFDYEYDLTGQLVNASRSTLGDESFAYDANGNRVDVGTVIGTNNQVETDGLFNYEYDGEGNLVRKTEIATGEVTEYTYDHRNRLVNVERQSAGGIILSENSYTYDALDRRTAVAVNGETIHTVYNAENAWADFDASGTVIASYLFGNQLDQILARFRSGEGTAWHLADRLGTIRDILGSSGTIVSNIEYGSFGGVVTITNPSTADRFLFTGRELDSQTGLHYYRARFYDPSLGRFTSQDPIGFAALDANLMRYVFNSPLNATDPTGLQSAIESAVLTSIITAAASGVGLACAGAPIAGAPGGLAAGIFGTGVGGGVAAGSGVLAGVGASSSAGAAAGAGPAAAALATGGLAIGAVGAALTSCFLYLLYVVSL